MTTVSDIITRAYRESNTVAIGATPTDDQVAEAFALLSTIVISVLGNEGGEQLSPMPLGQNEITSPKGYPWWSNELPGNVFIPTNTRIMCNLTGAGQVNFHPRPHDGARMGIIDVSQNFDTTGLTIFGNGRSIEGSDQQIYITPGEIREWFYRGDLGDWVVVTPLDQAGDLPFPPEFDDMFIIRLALRLNPRYGQTLDPASQAALKKAMTQFSARYKQSDTQMPSEDGLVYMTNYNRLYGRFSNRQYGDPSDFFNSGYPY